MRIFEGIARSLLRDASDGGKILTLTGWRRFLVTPADVAALIRLEGWFFSTFILLVVLAIPFVSAPYLVGMGIPLGILVHIAVLELFARRLRRTDEVPVSVLVTETTADDGRAAKRTLVFGLLVSLAFVCLGAWLL